MTQTCVIVNPNAGGGRARRRAPEVVARLRSIGMSIVVHETSAPHDATRFAEDAARRGVRRFVAVGGDGTTHEVLNGLRERLGQVALGIVPMGTGNSFLRDFGITTADEAIRRIARGATRSCDLLEVRHADGTRLAFNVVGIGFAAEAGALTNREYKSLGVLGYVIAVLQSTWNLSTHRLSIALDGGAVDARAAVLVSFSNSRCTGGGMQMAPGAALDDGEVDVVRIGPIARHRFIAAFPRIFAGTHVALPEVEVQRAKLVSFHDDVGRDVMIDGEIATWRLRSIEVRPRAFEVFA